MMVTMAQSRLSNSLRRNTRNLGLHRVLGALLAIRDPRYPDYVCPRCGWLY